MTGAAGSGGQKKLILMPGAAGPGSELRGRDRCPHVMRREEEREDVSLWRVETVL